MSPRVLPHAIVWHGSSRVHALLFAATALVLSILLAGSAARAQSNSVSSGWQAAPAGSSREIVHGTSEPAPPQDDGWRRAPANSATAATPFRDNMSDAAPARPSQPLSADSVFDDPPRPKMTRSLVWQPQAEPAGGARRYPAQAQPPQRKANSGVVRTAYEFDDPRTDPRRAPAVATSGPEPIPAPEPVPAPNPLPANSGMIYDDPSEAISGGGGETDVDLGDESCGCCDNCGHCDCLCCCRPFAGKLWVRAEYLLWWSPGYSVPALITTSTSSDFSTAGALGQSGTSVLFGNGQLANENRSGIRIGAGYLLMPCRDISIEGYYTTTGTLSNSFAANSIANPTLAIPYSNVLSDAQGPAAHLIAFPGEATGAVSVTATSEFNSAEALLRRKVRDEQYYHVDFICGYRYARLMENLQISESQSIIGPRMPFPEGTSVNINDAFNTLNEFNGAEVGFTFSEQYRRWTLDVVAKLALGNTHTQVSINGVTAQTGVGGVSNATLTYPGGVLALPSNSGVFQTDSITAIPELGVKLGFHLNRRTKLTAGYNFTYWSKVARPGDQIDTNINQSQIPPNTLGGAAFPQYPGKTTDFWLQGITAGLEYRF